MLVMSLHCLRIETVLILGGNTSTEHSAWPRRSPTNVHEMLNGICLGRHKTTAPNPATYS